jgi:hypothetical protein
MVMDIKLLQNWHFATEHIFCHHTTHQIVHRNDILFGSFGAMTALYINETPISEILVVL